MGSKKLLELFDRTEPEDWAILAGAGISAPSGMPIGTGLMQHIIDSFVPNRYARDQISVLLEPKNPSSSWLRFEGLNQLLQDLSLDRDLEILNVYTKGTPNLNHQVLAHLAVEGSLVFTTNFDCLIEIALCSLLQETNGLLYYSPPDRLPPGGIFPIHGALHRYDSDCARRAPGDVSPAVTLAGVGRTRNNAAWREMFKQAISSRKLLVIGYSGSDDFDIAYWLGERQGAKETLWVLHEAVGDCIPVPVSESDGGSERRHWPLLELWRRWTESAQPCKDLFNYVEGNTMTILASVAGCLLDSVPSTGEEQQQTSAVKEQIASFLEVWRDKRNPDLFKKNLFTGQTLCSLQRYKEGVKFLEAGLQRAVGSEQELEALLLLSRAEAEISGGQYRRLATEHARRAMELEEKKGKPLQALLTLARVLLYGDRNAKSKAFDLLSPFVEVDGDPIQRQLYVERCRVAARVDADTSEKGKKEKRKRILKDLRTAANNAKENGDLLTEAVTLHEVGKWTARWQLEKDTKHNIPMLQGVAADFQEAVRLRQSIGAYREASASANVAAGILMQLADWTRWSAKSETSRGPDLNRALGACKSALENAKRGNSAWDEAQAYLKKSVLEFRSYSFRESENALRAAESPSLSEQWEDNKDKARLKHQAGLIAFVYQNHERATRLFLEADELASTANDLLSQAVTGIGILTLDGTVGEGKRRGQAVKRIESTLRDLRSSYPYHCRRIEELTEALKQGVTLQDLCSRPWVLVDSLP